MTNWKEARQHVGALARFAKIASDRARLVEIGDDQENERLFFHAFYWASEYGLGWDEAVVWFRSVLGILKEDGGWRNGFVSSRSDRVLKTGHPVLDTLLVLGLRWWIFGHQPMLFDELIDFVASVYSATESNRGDFEALLRRLIDLRSSKLTSWRDLLGDGYRPRDENVVQSLCTRHGIVYYSVEERGRRAAEAFGLTTLTLGAERFQGKR